MFFKSILSLILVSFLMLENARSEATSGDKFERVMKMLANVFEDNPDELAKMTMILGFEEDPRYVQVLDGLIVNPEAFKTASLNIIQDMEESKKMPEYRKLMAVMYDNTLQGKDSEEIMDFEWTENDEAFQITTQFNILKAFKNLPKDLQSKVLEQTKPFSLSLLKTHLPSELQKYAMKSLAILENHGRNDVIPETIVIAQLSWHTYQNILRWWNGQISGQRCVKNIIDDVATVTGGICGATMGG